MVKAAFVFVHAVRPLQSNGDVWGCEITLVLTTQPRSATELSNDSRVPKGQRGHEPSTAPGHFRVPDRFSLLPDDVDCRERAFPNPGRSERCGSYLRWVAPNSRQAAGDARALRTTTDPTSRQGQPACGFRPHHGSRGSGRWSCSGARCPRTVAVRRCRTIRRSRRGPSRVPGGPERPTASGPFASG